MTPEQKAKIKWYERTYFVHTAIDKVGVPWVECLFCGCRAPLSKVPLPHNAVCTGVEKDAELEALLAQVKQLEQERDDFESGYKSQARRNCALHDEIKALRLQLEQLRVESDGRLYDSQQMGEMLMSEKLVSGDLRAQVARLVDALTLLEALPIHELHRVYPLTREALASTAQSAREWLEAVKRKAYKEGAAAAWSRAAEFEVDPQFKQEYQDRAAALLKEAAAIQEGR